jgi:hypothetical protein
MRVIASALAVGCFHVAVSLAYQQPPQQAFKSSVHLLEVDARVFDRDGRFVMDLTMDLTVRARKGYLALPPSKMLIPQPVR